MLGLIVKIITRSNQFEFKFRLIILTNFYIAAKLYDLYNNLILINFSSVNNTHPVLGTDFVICFSIISRIVD